MLKRLLAWLRRDEYVKAAVEAASSRAYQSGYHVGLAHGEILGREKLADDLVEIYGDGGRLALTAEDAMRIRSSTRH